MKTHRKKLAPSRKIGHNSAISAQQNRIRIWAMIQKRQQKNNFS